MAEQLAAIEVDITVEPLEEQAPAAQPDDADTNPAAPEPAAPAPTATVTAAA